MILNYLEPLCKNVYASSDKQFSTLLTMEQVEEHDSYDVGSLFTKILVKETTDYILDQNYAPICIE